MNTMWILIAFLALPNLIYGQTNINLITPSFILFKLDSSNVTSFNVSLHTRAAEYKLLDFKPYLKDASNLVRTSEWKQPKVSEQTLIHGGNGKTFSEHANRSSMYLSKWTNNVNLMMVDSLPPWLICQAFVVHKWNGVDYELCFRDFSLYACDLNTPYYPCLPLHLMSIVYDSHPNDMKRKYMVPFTSVLAIEEILMPIDATGRMFHWTLNRQNPNLKFDVSTASLSVDLSAIPIFEDRLQPWAEKINRIKNGNLRSRYLNDSETKFRASFVQAITPIYPGNSDADKVALCFASVYEFSTGFKLYCSLKGQDQSKFLPELYGPKSKIVFHALHIANDRDRSFIHVAYTKKYQSDAPNLHYVFCPIGSPAKGEETKEILVLETEEKNPSDPGCIPTDIQKAPNDIIGFDNGAECKRTIAFFDMLYTVHNVDQSIISKAKPQVLDKINFYINAAFALGTKIYFFTHSNTLLVVEASMSDGCKRLELGSMEEKIASDYVISNALKGDDYKYGPAILDYREFQEGAQDTQPPLDYRPGQDIVTERPNNGTEGPINKQSGSNVLIIAIGLILGGLIIAGVMYMLCMKGEDTPVRARKSRKSKFANDQPAAKRQDLSSLNIKTVRSSYQSPSTASSPLSSNTSKSQMPTLKRKSRKGSKSFSGLKSLTGSKSLAGSKSPKSKVTKSPLTRKSSASKSSPVGSKMTVSRSRKSSAKSPSS